MIILARPRPCWWPSRLVERRAAEPVLPAQLLRRRLLSTTSCQSGRRRTAARADVLRAAVVQSVLDQRADRGFALAALTIGWPIAASTAGRLYLRIGFRNTALIGWR